MDYKGWIIGKRKRRKLIKTSVRPSYVIVRHKNYGDVKLFCIRFKHF
jgi:hypothetical protein